MVEGLKKETKDNQCHIAQGQGQIKDLWKRSTSSLAVHRRAFLSDPVAMQTGEVQCTSKRREPRAADGEPIVQYKFAPSIWQAKPDRLEAKQELQI